MKKYFVLILASVLGLVSCEKPLQLVDVKFQLAYDGEALALAEAPVEAETPVEEAAAEIRRDIIELGVEAGDGRVFHFNDFCN